MPELKLGTKFECHNCRTKFYDLGKSDPVCPKCGANPKDAGDAELPILSAAARRKRKAEIPKPPEEEEVEQIEEIEAELGGAEDLDADLEDEEEEEADFDAEV